MAGKREHSKNFEKVKKILSEVLEQTESIQCGHKSRIKSVDYAGGI